MRIRYDQEVDAAYIQLDAGDVAFNVPCDPEEVDGMINLDFDSSGVLRRIEVLDAKHKLPAELLDEADSPGTA